MKHSNLRSGHRAAATARSTAAPWRRASFRILSCAVLAAASLPALAQQASDAATAGAVTAELTIDSATLLAAAASAPAPTAAVPAPATPAASTAAGAAVASPSAAVPANLTLSDRALLLAADMNRLLAPSAEGDAAGSAEAPTSGRINQLLKRALALLGTPYRWGGTSPEKGFDCSGLVGYVFRNALGIELPRISRDIARTGQLIARRDELAEGDLVFFGRKGRVDHVGIYVGEGQFVHAPSRGKDVTISSLESGYWGGKFMQARRVEGI